MNLPPKLYNLWLQKHQKKVLAKEIYIQKNAEYLSDTGFTECNEEGIWLTKRGTALYTEAPNE